MSRRGNGRCHSLLLTFILPLGLAASASGLQGGGSVDAQDLPKAKAPAPAKPSESAVTEADRIVRLEKTLAADEASLTELRSLFEIRQREEASAGKAFQQITAEVEGLGLELQKAKDKGDTTAAAETGTRLKQLQVTQGLAKEKFDLAIAARKTAQEQISTLEAKTAQDKKSLDKLKGVAPMSLDPADRQVPVTPAPETAPPASPADTKLPPENGSVTDAKQAAQSQAEKAARKEVERKEKALAELEQDLEDLVVSKTLLQKNIELESQTLATTRQQDDVLEKVLEAAEANFNERLAANAPASELQQLRKTIGDTRRQLHDNRLAIVSSTDRLQNLRDQLLALQTEEVALIRQSHGLRRQADAAKRGELYVKVQQYVITTGPKLLATLVVMFVLWTFLKLVCARAKQWFARDESANSEDRKHRSRTLIAVFQNTGNAVILVGGVLMLLEAAGVPIAPLLGGAGVVGLAIAFAAQSLVKDYFCGFILLLEDQYKIGDVVTINGMSGTVERITLRITVLRNLNGHVFYIPNGQITAVQNSTEGWARVVLDVTVGYGEDIDQVLDVLQALVGEFTGDDAFGASVVGEPEMFGVDALGDSSVVVKVGLKVRPEKQWAIKRELLQRIKQRFDELGIEIPFPQRTVHHRMEDGKKASVPAPTPLDGEQC